MIGVFGASGFIGKHLTTALVDDGEEVTAVARHFDDALAALPARVVAGDLRDPGAMSTALAGVDTVVQLMSSSTPALGNTRTSEDIKLNVIPHVAFLNQCIEAGVRRVVFASSGGTVYGPVSGDQPVAETAATHPISSYGVTKLMVEQFIRLHAHLDGLEFVILRIANPYGPGQILRNGQGLVPALVERYKQGLPITIFGDGSAARDYIYIDDVVDALKAAVRLEGQPGLVVNVGTGTRRSIIEVVHTIEEVAGIRFQIEHAPARDSDVRSIALDITQARRALAWQPTTTFVDGLRATVVPSIGHQ